MTPPDAWSVVAALRRTFGPEWTVDTNGLQLSIEHRLSTSPFRPRRSPLDWHELLNRLHAAFDAQGFEQAAPLPLRWGKETDFTISAIQAFDPYVKQAQPFTYRDGYLPQPVVRLSAKRDVAGRLLPGRLTSFVNVSLVRRIASLDEYAATVGIWLSAISAIGLHARHIRTYGSLQIWHRREVSGITLRFDHAALPIGDLVLIWNTNDPAFMVADLGSGLETLKRACTRAEWTRMVFGNLADYASSDTLDAIRTVTLMIGSGIRPTARGPGSAVRRLIRGIPASEMPLGTSTAVRAAYEFWTLTAPMQAPWHEITRLLDERGRRTRSITS